MAVGAMVGAFVAGRVKVEVGTGGTVGVGRTVSVGGGVVLAAGFGPQPVKKKLEKRRIAIILKRHFVVIGSSLDVMRL
jgi:hypothetical protein